jgi:methylated-DNA-[protein]-cysteine S-methyltransferase
MNIFYKSELQTFIGNISLFFSAKGLIKVGMTSSFDVKWYRNYFHNTVIKSSNDNTYISQLNEYFRRKRKEFDFPFVLYGTFFQKEVWRFVHKIPFGETMTYSEVARGISRKFAQRAVGNALAKNPLLIVIPCHRVIKSDGSLGGFSAGIETKRELLEFEKSFSVSDEPQTYPPLRFGRRGH